ncbi:MAG: TetR family transcriptional regulator C-terminal domain-containing protein, partial [Planctomycetota bacterium]
KKDDLVSALQMRCQVEYGERYRAVASGPGRASEKLLSFTEIFVESVKNGKLCLLAMLSAEYNSLSDDLRLRLDESVRDTTDIYEIVFRQGIEEGDFSPQLNARDAALAFLSMLMGGHLLARCSGGGEALMRSASEYIRVLVA